MQPAAVQNAMYLLAILTPVLAAMIYGARRIGRLPGPGPALWKVAVLGAAGPVNLLAWLLLNGWLDRIGHRSVIGYVLAAVVFVVAGFATGWFSRRRSRGDTQT